MLITLISFSCKDNLVNPQPPDNADKVTINQGVWGNVWFWEGDFMPSTDNSSSGRITPVIREIYIHEATRFDSVEMDTSRSGFIKTISTKFVAKVISDRDGFFQIELDPGKYSFFVKEDSLYLASESDSEGHLVAAEFDLGKVVKRQININYNAVY